MEEQKQSFVISPLLILLFAAAFGAVSWLVLMGRMQPGLDSVGRAKIIEPLIDECFGNGLLLTARVEKNVEDAYEILSETREYDPFSKHEIRVVHRGKKLNEPEAGCTLNIKRVRLVRFYGVVNTRFRMSAANAAAWRGITEELKALGVLSPGEGNINVYFKDCDEAKRLYDRMQSFLAVSRSYEYDFNY